MCREKALKELLNSSNFKNLCRDLYFQQKESPYSLESLTSAEMRVLEAAAGKPEEFQESVDNFILTHGVINELFTAKKAYDRAKNEILDKILTLYRDR